MDTKEPAAIEDVWKACVDALIKEPAKPILLWAIAENCNWDETKLMTAFINYTGHNGAVVDFAFGPHYVALTGMADKSGYYGSLVK